MPAKRKPSKLDPFAERLDEWFLAGQPLLYAQTQLALDGCRVSLSTLSEWWQARQGTRQEEQFLKQIATGADTCRKTAEEFGENPPPAIDTLIKVHQVLVLKLSTAGQVDHDLLDVANRMMKSVLSYYRMQQTGEALALEQTKFRAAQQTKLDAGLDELAGLVKPYPDLVSEFQGWRGRLNERMAK